ncbi:MAG: hypothetical protein HOL32_11580 [Octadecabacter sp.]|jgi:hypothetical protein|nr:hypothetical protein [Octadecabacter sp.]
MKHYSLYLLALAVLALVAIQTTTPMSVAGFGGAIAMVCVLLAHLPTFLPVAMVEEFFGKAPAPLQPLDVLLTLVVVFSWLMVEVVDGPGWSNPLTVLLVPLGLAMGFGAVRVNSRLAAEIARHAAPNPVSDIQQLRQVTARAAYILRALAAAASLITALWVLGAGTDVASAWGGAGAALCGAAALVVVGVGVNAMRQQARGAGQMAGVALSHMEHITQGPAEVILYCSNKPTAKHDRINKLAAGMVAEGLRCAIVAREWQSLKLLKSFGATYLWPVPFLAGISAVARPDVRAVFYTHDGVKNGHFTRFNQFRHILEAKTGALARAESLPQSVSMYDYVIAPSPSVAAAWRAADSAADPGRILTTDFSKLAPAMEGDPQGALANVALFLPPPETAYTPVPAATRTAIQALFRHYQAASDAHMNALTYQDLIGPVPSNKSRPRSSLSEISRLYVSFAPGDTDALTLWHKPLLAIADDEDVPLISHAYGQPKTIWAEGQILMVATYDQAVILRATGKPLLWIGEGPAPEGMVAYCPSSAVPIHEQARPAAPDPHHFTSYRALMANVAPVASAAGGKRG